MPSSIQRSRQSSATAALAIGIGAPQVEVLLAKGITHTQPPALSAKYLLIESAPTRPKELPRVVFFDQDAASAGEIYASFRDALRRKRRQCPAEGADFRRDRLNQDAPLAADAILVNMIETQPDLNNLADLTRRRRLLPACRLNIDDEDLVAPNRHAALPDAQNSASNADISAADVTGKRQAKFRQI